LPVPFLTTDSLIDYRSGSSQSETATDSSPLAQFAIPALNHQ